MILQLTVFLQNEKGTLSRLTRTIADADINMHAMFLSDTAEFGIARIFCDAPEKVAEMLTDAGFRAAVTPVNAVHVPNEPGGLARLLDFCNSADINIEYAYCFKVGDDTAIDVFKVENENIDEALRQAGFRIAEPEDIYAF